MIYLASTIGKNRFNLLIRIYYEDVVNHIETLSLIKILESCFESLS